MAYASNNNDVYVVGLCFALIIFGAIPVTSNAALAVGLLLLLVEWSQIFFGTNWSAQ